MTLLQYIIEILELLQLKHTKYNKSFPQAFLEWSFCRTKLELQVTKKQFLKRRRVNQVRHGTESVYYLALKIWDILPMGNERVWNAPYLRSKNQNIPAGNYMFKVNNRNTRTRCQIYSKLTIKTPVRRYWHRSKGMSLWTL